MLDEAAELPGLDDRAERAREEGEHRERVAYAQGVLDITRGSRPVGLEDDQEAGVLSVSDIIDAGQLAQRHENPDYRTPAERAAADRLWAFGHVIVDEAQELPEMDWRLLMRRCPVCGPGNALFGKRYQVTTSRVTTPDYFGTVRAALAGMPGLPPDAGTAGPFPLPAAGRWANPRAPRRGRRASFCSCTAVASGGAAPSSRT